MTLTQPHVPRPIVDMSGFPEFHKYSNVSPFTVQDASTFLMTFTDWRAWIRDVLVPHVDNQIGWLDDSWRAQALAIATAVEKAIDENQQNVAEQLADQLTEFNALIQQIINSSIEVQDPVVQGILTDPTSLSRIALDGIFATKANLDDTNTRIDDVDTIIETGRLSPGDLDARYLEQGYILCKGPGIDPTGATDSSAAFQVLLRQAQTSGKVLLIPAGTFVVNNVTTLTQVDQPRVRGFGKLTTLKGTGLGIEDRILTFNGVSGQYSGGELGYVQYTNPNGIGVEIAGAIGVVIDAVRAQTTKIGVLFHNRDTGHFTEFCQIRNSYLEAGCIIAIEYRRTLGASSFHGSGFVNTVINQSESATAPAILVGAACNVYNAPWDGTWWGRVAGVSPIKTLGSTAKVYGHLQCEVVAAQTLVDETSAGIVYYTGTLSRFGGGMSRGTKFILSDDVSHNGDGTISAAFKQRQYAAAGPANPRNLLNMEAQTMLITATIQDTGYTYSQLLMVSQTSGDFSNGVVTVVATHRSLDTAGFGAPVWGVANSRLIVTNTKYTANTVIDIGAISLMGRRGVGNLLT